MNVRSDKKTLALASNLVSPLNGGVKDEEDASRAQYTTVTIIAGQTERSNLRQHVDNSLLHVRNVVMVV